MNKHWAWTYRAIMIGIAVMSVAMMIEAIIRETPCCPKGAQFGFGLAVLVLAYIGWPPDPKDN